MKKRDKNWVRSVKCEMANPFVIEGRLFGTRKELKEIYGQKEDTEILRRANEQAIESAARSMLPILKLAIEQAKKGEIQIEGLKIIIETAKQCFLDKCQERCIGNLDRQLIELNWKNILKKLKQEIKTK